MLLMQSSEAKGKGISDLISQKCHFGPTANKCDRCARANRDCGPCLLPREDSGRRRHEGAKKRLAQRVRQVLEAGVSEQTIDTALLALFSPKPAEAIGLEMPTEGETNLRPLSSDLIENMESGWASFEDINPDLIYTFLQM
jgi:hypothetical protein